PVGASADAILERPLSVFLLGLLVLILTVPALAILAATVIGLAIVPFVLCAFVVAGLIGKAGVARALGRSLAGDRLQGSMLASLVAFALGGAVLIVAYMVPVLGLVTWAFTSVLAVGAAAVMLRRRLRFEGRGRQRVAGRRTGIEPQAAGPAEAPEAASAAGSFAGARFQEPPPPAGAPFEEPPPAVEPPPLAGAPSPDRVLGAVRGGLFPPATFLDRVAAFALDCLLVALAVQLLDLSRYEGAFPLLLVAYHIAFWAWKGTTLGGVVIGLRVTRVNGQDLRFADALVRGLSGVFSIAALGIGCFWMLQDPARQMWHDKIAGTQVLKVPREMVLQEN
ncbi:MAG: RDD family protein, partial [Acidobacteria bacterium]